METIYLSLVHPGTRGFLFHEIPGIIIVSQEEKKSSLLFLFLTEGGGVLILLKENRGENQGQPV